MYPGATMVVVGSEKWISGNQTSKHHLVRQFLNLGARIIYVENISMRRLGSGGSSDVSKSGKILRAVMRGVHSPHPGLYCYTPLYLPFHSTRLARAFNSAFLTLQLRVIMAKFKIHHPVYLYFVPTGVLLNGRLGESLSAYYIVDNFAAFEDVDKEAMRAFEKQALDTADRVFATATTIVDRLRAQRDDIVYSPHGVDYDFFARARNSDTQVPDEVASISHPRIGFMGSLAGDSVDLELIERLAKRRPDWQFILLGRATSDVTSLIALPNVHYISARPYNQMPAYLKAFDVALIPFLVNELTLDLNPIKLREYLAAGLPTVATRLPAMETYEPHVKCVLSDDEWMEAVDSFLRDPGDKEERQASVKNESWENRAQGVAAVLAQAAAERNQSRTI